MYRVLIKRIIKSNQLCITNHQKFYRTGGVQFAKSNSTETNKKENEHSSEAIVDFDGSKISPSVQKKLKPKLPIVKNFFVGQVDKELIPFPEVIERDDMTKLYEEIQNVQQYFREKIDHKTINKNGNISKEIISDLKSLGCFSFNVPKHHGRGYSISESLIASESEQISTDISSILTSHRTVVDLLNEYGTENQKQKYLPKLADGSFIATSAIYESKFAEENLFNTIADYDDIESVWTLNGHKSVIINGIGANLFLVIAQISKLTISGEPGISTAVFLVEDSTPGLQKSEEIQSHGLRGSKLCNLSFNKVKLSKECLIGTVDNGNEVAQMLMKMYRLRSSLQNFTLMKQIINHMTEMCINNKQCGVSLTEMELNHKRLSKAICAAYATESMIYYTAGIMDEFEKPDVDVECAIIKLFSIENLWSTVKSSMECLGPTSFLSKELPEVILRNAVQLYTGGEILDSLHSFIGLSGLQYAGINVYDTIKKQRNPLFNPGHIFSKLFERNSIEAPKLHLNLQHDLHPSLVIPSQWLELSIARLEICTELLLTRHGTDIFKKQIDIQRLSKIVTHLYAMYACLSRSSRSYCIGLKFADYEMLLATTYCLYGRDIIKNLCTDIMYGEYINNDRNFNRLSKQIYKSHGYFAEHPLKYNF